MKRTTLALSLALFLGCDSGPRMHEVSGTVTLNGAQPLPDGEILFEHVPTPTESYGPDHGRIKDGRFRLRVKEGNHLIRITADQPILDTKNMYGEPLTKNYLATRYNQETTLTADVGVGKTTFTFNVESAP